MQDEGKEAMPLTRAGWVGGMTGLSRDYTCWVALMLWLSPPPTPKHTHVWSAPCSRILGCLQDEAPSFLAKEQDPMGQIPDLVCSLTPTHHLTGHV